MVSSNIFARAAVLLAASAQVCAAASAVIHNQCDFDVYLWSVSNVAGEMQTLKANGGEYTESYRVNPNGGGVSIKMGSDTGCQNITQYEYTFVDGALWYDLSNINGYPFMEYGVTVVPQDASCRSVSCPAGTELCAAAYNIPSDNFATAECSASADTVVVLCSYEENTDGSASVSSVASSAVATATPVSTVIAATTTPYAHSTVTSSHSSAKHTVWHHPSSNILVATATAAPNLAAAEQNNNPFVVYETTFVTHIVTVNARAAAPSPAAVVEKRSPHNHRAAHDHVVKRHAHPHAPQA